MSDAKTSIVKVTGNDTSRLLTVEWEGAVNGVKTRQYPYSWLRDSCPCPTCMHPTTLSRRFLMRHFDPRVQPTSLDADASKVIISWSDGHNATIDSTWLLTHSFDPVEQQRRLAFNARPIKHWGSELQGHVERFDFNKLLTDDSELHRWLVTLEETGIVLACNSPCEPGQLERLAARVAYLRQSHHTYQKPVFDVINKSDPNNLAYTNLTLGLHSDFAYYEFVPGVQLLHCIQQTATEGGDNEFSDAFHVAEQLRRDKPEVFKVLSTTPVDFYDVGVEDNTFKFYLRHQKPVIILNAAGDIVEIAYNNQVRDYTLNLPVDKVDQLYSALRAFDDALYAANNIIRLKLVEGDIVTFANTRVLHGRVGFVAASARHLQGGYINWDEIRSRRRVLDLELYADKFPLIR